MKFVKLGLITIVFFSILLTAFSLLLPSETNISRAIDINAPADTVYNYINNLADWKHWYAEYDSSKTKVSTDNKSLTVNNTVITITRALPDKVNATWQTGQNNPVKGEFNIISKESGASVTLQWNFIQKVKWYPWQKFASIASGKIIGPFMEKSLQNLKARAEK